MRTSSILFGILVLLTSITFASCNELSSGLDIVGSKAEFIELVSSCEKLKLDIVGSLADNIQIVSPCAKSEDIEIVGGTAKNISIYSKVPKERKECFAPQVCERYEPVYCPIPVSSPRPTFKPHLGVDAWYGQYWYASSINTPKWPQIS
ncbi:MAG: hypothetical protein MUO26_00480 [Methanotrichaceae archaeon]|nr:hypothetical protein [Methanotrichaceae archaeon]